MQKLNDIFSGGGDGDGTTDSFLEDGSEGLCALSTTQVPPRCRFRYGLIFGVCLLNQSSSILQRMYGFAASLATGLLLMFLVKYQIS